MTPLLRPQCHSPSVWIDAISRWLRGLAARFPFELVLVLHGRWTTLRR